MIRLVDIAALILLFAFAAGIVGCVKGIGDHTDAVEAKDLYCAMVAEWEDGKMRGLRPEERGGWPPFKDDVQCKTTKMEPNNVES